MRCLIYSDAVWRLYDEYIEIGELRNFLGGHREVFFDTCKEVFKEVDYGFGAQEFIGGSSNYYNVISIVFVKGVDSMGYDMLEKPGKESTRFSILFHRQTSGLVP